MHAETLPQGLATIQTVTTQTGLKRPTVIAELNELADLLEAVERTLSNYSLQLYQQNLESILRAFCPGKNGGWRRRGRSVHAANTGRRALQFWLPETRKPRANGRLRP
jgi:hypothetical protein